MADKTIATYMGRYITGEASIKDLLDKLEELRVAQAAQHTALLAKLDQLIAAQPE